jgi:hypothetical protein
MARYRVGATFEITVEVTYWFEDDEEVEGLDASLSADEQIKHRASMKADEIKEDCSVDLGCDEQYISDVTYSIGFIEAQE